MRRCNAVAVYYFTQSVNVQGSLVNYDFAKYGFQVFAIFLFEYTWRQIVASAHKDLCLLVCYNG
jgi:hypothetical protein